MMDRTQDARAFLAEVMGLYRAELTSLERDFWVNMIDEFGHEAIIKFLTHHVQTSQFFPKPVDVIRTLRPGAGTTDSALAELVKAVIKFGPYRTPRFSDPALSQTVEDMGGWMRLNEILPEPSSRIEFDNFSKRFDTAYRKAVAQVMYLQVDQSPLIGKARGGLIGYQV